MIFQTDTLPNTIEELIQFLQGKDKTFVFSDNEIKLFWLAYNFAKSAHGDQKRATGEPYLIHPLSVARILVELNLDAESIAVAFLHDVAEDTSFTIQQISENFGSTIASLVDGVTKLSKYDFPDKTRRDAGAIRKLFLAMISDVRVIVIKLSDRLHNLRTINALPIDRQRKMAKETLEIYAPIAERLGIWNLKGDLEDLAFRCLEPKLYEEIAQGLEKSRDDHDTILINILEAIKTKMLQSGFQEGTFEVFGRRKYIYSIYKKMHKPKYEGKGLDRIYDKLGIRIIVSSVQDCYSVLGLVHSTWSPLPGEFDDYIGMRIPSGYQSLHTTVKYGSGKNDFVEFQIRSFQMHENAEYGVAAHWIYKEKQISKKDMALEQKLTWLRQMLEEPQNDDPESFVAVLKADVLQDRVYTFTPKGDIIDLPVGSTPLDFAFSVHTDIGYRCRGAKVNGRLVSLDYILKTGDQVNILIAKHGGPSRDWLNSNLGLVTTQRAKAKIRQWFKRLDREQNITQGNLILERELHRLGIQNLDIDQLARGFEYKTVDDLYVALGCGDISLSKIINQLFEHNKDKDPLLEFTPQKEKIETSDSIQVLGLKGLLNTLARCCNPAPGDEIVGYITRGRGATIHRWDCPNVLRLEERERLVKVSWGEPHKTFPVSVEIKAYDRQGLMGDISNILKEENINILDVDIKVNHNLASIRLVIEVFNITQLSRVLTRVENLANIMEAHRVKPG